MGDIAKVLTREFESRELWRGGMRRIRNDRALRSRDLGMAYCDVREREVRCIVWDGERGSLFGLLPDEAWDVDLDDAATEGVLWRILCEEATTRHDWKDLAMDASGLVTWKQLAPDVDGSHKWESWGAPSITHALFDMWGLEVEQ